LPYFLSCAHGKDPEEKPSTIHSRQDTEDPNITTKSHRERGKKKKNRLTLQSKPGKKLKLCDHQAMQKENGEGVFKTKKNPSLSAKERRESRQAGPDLTAPFEVVVERGKRRKRQQKKKTTAFLCSTTQKRGKKKEDKSRVAQRRKKDRGIVLPLFSTLFRERGGRKKQDVHITGGKKKGKRLPPLYYSNYR